MFAVRVDSRLNEYRARIIYALDYIFDVLGYGYRLLGEEDSQRRGEMLFLYSYDMQLLEDYLEFNPRGFAICVLHDELLYDTESFDHKELKRALRRINIGYDLPYISSRSMADPMSRSCDVKHHSFYMGVFHFDLVGNVFFHLHDSESRIDRQRDQHERYSYGQSVFREFYDYPYLTGMINLINLFMQEGSNYFAYPVIKKPLWPENRQYAVSLTHNVNKLIKWNPRRFFASIWDSIRTFWRVIYHWRNFGGFILYLFGNWEPYWNFDLLCELEAEAGLGSTFFFGVAAHNKYDIDYSVDDEDMDTQRDELLAAGKELGLLSYYESINVDDFGERAARLSEFYGSRVAGVRQSHYRRIEREKSEFYSKAGLEWDSSWSMPDRQGFVNGVGYPFFLTGEKWRQKTVLELPVNFNDEVIKYDKPYNTPEGVKTRLDNLIDSARRFNSLLVFNFNVESFEEIKYLEQTYKWLLERINGDPTVWKTTLKRVHNWIRKRASVQISARGELIEITCHKALEEFTLYIQGLWRVCEIENRLKVEEEQEELDIFAESTWWQVKGGEVMITGRQIRFKQVEKGCVIKIRMERFGKQKT